MAIEIYESTELALTGQGITLYQKLTEFVKNSLHEGEHYGKVPNTSKPCLFKGGAELINKEAQLIPAYEVLYEKVDFDQPVFAYMIKTTLLREGHKVSEGFGSCSSMEKKYTGDKIDKYFIWNTILKMAKKRSYVDATITAWGLSGIFTQDIEELEAPPAEKKAKPFHTRQVPPEYEGNMPDLPPDKPNAQFPPQKPKLPPLEINTQPDFEPSEDDKEYDRQQALALHQLHNAYFASLPEELKDEAKRHQWQYTITGKESTKDWTQAHYQKAIDALEAIRANNDPDKKTLPDLGQGGFQYSTGRARMKATDNQRAFLISHLNLKGYKKPADLDDWTKGQCSLMIDYLKGNLDRSVYDEHPI
jgi:hypothetical protein